MSERCLNYWFLFFFLSIVMTVYFIDAHTVDGGGLYKGPHKKLFKNTIIKMKKITKMKNIMDPHNNIYLEKDSIPSKWIFNPCASNVYLPSRSLVSNFVRLINGEKMNQKKNFEIEIKLAADVCVIRFDSTFLLFGLVKK